MFVIMTLILIVLIISSLLITASKSVSQINNEQIKEDEQNRKDKQV